MKLDITLRANYIQGYCATPTINLIDFFNFDYG